MKSHPSPVPDLTDAAPGGNKSLRHYESGEERRAAIALAARDIIAEKGFEGLRTRDLAARVGINVATLHYHVPSRDALISLLTTSMRAQFVARARRDRPDTLPADRALRVEMTEFLHARRADPHLYEAVAELAQRARRDENVARHMRAMRDGWCEAMACIIRAGIDDGLFRSDLDAATAARLVIATISGLQQWTDGETAHVEAAADMLIQSFLARQS